MLSLQPLWTMLAVALLAMAATWELQRRTGNAGYVDVAWAGLMGVAAIYYGAVGAGATWPRLLVAMLGGLWGFRLCLHLLARVLDEPEDGRYRHLRTHWRGSQPRFLAFFMAQALLVGLFSVPFLVAAANPAAGIGPWAIAGVVVWLLSQAGESIADAQLAAFRRNPAQAGRTCRQGLWRYSRHPNYFFEWLHWFSYVLIAIGAPCWWLALIGPLLMGASLLWITGIPYTEAQALRSRGDDYRAYQRETSMFFPWFPSVDKQR